MTKEIADALVYDLKLDGYEAKTTENDTARTRIVTDAPGTAIGFLMAQLGYKSWDLPLPISTIGSETVWS